MNSVTGDLIVRVSRRVSVEFDESERPEYEKGDKRFQLHSVVMVFEYRDEWTNPWSVDGVAAQKLRDGSWGKPTPRNLWDQRKLTTELCNRFRPTTTVKVSEVSA